MRVTLNLSDIEQLSIKESFQKRWDILTNQVHVWLIPFDERFIQTAILSSDELLRASEYTFDIHKKQFLMYRCALRQILSFYCKKRPEELIFGYTEYKKPYLLMNPYGAQFNLSHSSNMAVLGITKLYPIGIDIELIKPLEDMQLIAKEHFSKSEYNHYISLSEEDKLGAFYDIWTKKEAFVKAIGEGLSYSLNEFTVPFSNNEQPQIVKINNLKVGTTDWLIKSFNVQTDQGNYKLACAVKNRMFQVNKFTLLCY